MIKSDYFGFRLAPGLKARLEDMAVEAEMSAGEVVRKLLRQATMMPETRRSPSVEVIHTSPHSEAFSKGVADG